MKTTLVRNLFIIETVLISVEAVVGMVVNLYEVVPFPLNFDSYAYSVQGAGFGVHHYIGALVMLIAILTLAASIRIKNPLFSKISLLGLVLLLISYGGGTLFVFLTPNNFYSLIMATFAMSALVMYTSAIFLVPKDTLTSR